MGYLICKKCKSYYELKPGENPEDFINKCDCGGELKYSENIDVVSPNWQQAPVHLVCPKCGTKNIESAVFCEECGKSLGATKQSAKAKSNRVSKGQSKIKGINKNQKIILGAVGLLCVGLIFIIGISGMLYPDKTTTTPTSTNAPTNTQTTNTQNTQSTSSSSEFQPITLSGTGQQATQNFKWPGGLMRVTMSHQGKSNFIIKLMDSNTGQTEELVVNEIGSFSGSRAFNVPSGTYMLDVTADGSWSVQITK